MAAPTFTAYDLGDLDCPAGTLGVYLYSENAGLTIPAGIASSIMLSDWIVKSYDVSDNGGAFAKTRIELEEYYDTTYDGGFWGAVNSAGKWELRFYLDEGAGDTFLFWGRAVEFDGRWEEYSITSGSRARRASIQFIDALAERLAEVTAQELYDALDDVAYYVEVGSQRWVSFPTIFSKLLDLTFGQGIDLADTTLESEALEYEANGDWRTFLQLSTATQAFGIPDWVPDNQIENWLAWGWSGLDIVRQICREHCLYPEHDMNTGTGDHKIKLVGWASSEGYTNDVVVTPEAPIASTFYAKHPTVVSNIKISLYNSGSFYTWIGGQESALSIDSPNTTFDVNLALDWAGGIAYVTGGLSYGVTDSRYWQTGWSGGTGNLMKTVGRYIDENWGSSPGQDRQGYEREYFGIGMIASGATVAAHNSVKFGPDCYIEIDDDVLNRQFVPIEIAKHVMEYRLRVVWREFVTT